MKVTVPNLIKGLVTIAIGLTIAALGIYVGEIDDAPGAALIGIVLMIGSLVLGVAIARRQK